jgi:hypothetical protein
MATKKTAPKKPPSQAPRPRIPKLGDKVIPQGSEAVYTVWNVSADGTEVNISIQGTLIDRFRYPSSKLRWVEDE